MKINITELNVKREININDNFVFDEVDYAKVGIKKINNIHFDGKIYYEITDEIKITGKLIAELILEDAVDLSDVLYEINVNIEEILENYENILDINEILWENIVLEVPIRVSNKKLEEKEGNGWKILTEDSLDEKSIDPRLEKLQELFKGGE